VPGSRQSFQTIGTAEAVCPTNHQPDSFMKMRRWIQHCNQNHDCRPSRPELPTRVLNVGCQSDDSVFLLSKEARQRINRFAPPEACGRYVALSYCWGSSATQVHRTLTSNLVEHERVGVPVQRLPAAIQDAIRLARNLNYLYLWVDSLCIIQDDASDWARESACMETYYENADLVLLNATSDNCQKPMFINQIFGSHVCAASFVPFHWRRTANRNLTAYEPAFMSGVKKPEGSEDRVCIRVHPLYSHTISQGPAEPVRTRSWCFQEELLAHRTLTLSPFETSWRCHEQRSCECLGDSLSTPINWLGNLGKGLMKATESVIRDPSTILSVLELRRAWAFTIQAYQDRFITDKYDKLIAFQGIVDRYCRAWSRVLGQPARFYGGVWEHSALEDLIWVPLPRRNVISPLVWEWLEHLVRGRRVDDLSQVNGSLDFGLVLIGLSRSSSHFVDFFGRINDGNKQAIRGLVDPTNCPAFGVGKPLKTLEWDRKCRKLMFRLPLLPGFPSWSCLSSEHPIGIPMPDALAFFDGRDHFIQHAELLSIMTRSDPRDAKGRAIYGTVTLSARTASLRLRSSLPVVGKQRGPRRCSELFPEIYNTPEFASLPRELLAFLEYTGALTNSLHYARFDHDQSVCLWSSDTDCLYGDIERVYQGWGSHLKEEPVFRLSYYLPSFAQRILGDIKVSRDSRKRARKVQDTPGTENLPCPDMFPCWPPPHNFGCLRDSCEMLSCPCQDGWTPVLEGSEYTYWAVEMGSYEFYSPRGRKGRRTYFLVIRPSPFWEKIGDMPHVRIGIGWFEKFGDEPGWQSSPFDQSQRVELRIG
jgi:hypothetical protein